MFCVQPRTQRCGCNTNSKTRALGKRAGKDPSCVAVLGASEQHNNSKQAPSPKIILTRSPLLHCCESNINAISIHFCLEKCMHMYDVEVSYRLWVQMIASTIYTTMVRRTALPNTPKYSYSYTTPPAGTSDVPAGTSNRRLPAPALSSSLLLRVASHAIRFDLHARRMPVRGAGDSPRPVTTYLPGTWYGVLSTGTFYVPGK